ncbi:MAG: 50S ribosomal protein L21e [Candidatus Bathyarchaeota archaeon]|nr:MAG: 50S ribosomal protein L21e [Candidatus Bathyarchaeota archaeon]
MKSKGYRHKTRSLLRKKAREKGKTGLSKLLREYALGDRVVIKLDPGTHKGMPHRRFHGKIGIVENRRGQAYVINVAQGKAVKEIIVRPEHLEPFSPSKEE